MAVKTKIQWCDSTINPTMGCDGCEIWDSKRATCYAGKIHERFGGCKGYAPTFEQVTLFPGRMLEACHWSDLAGRQRVQKPWLDGLPRLIFVSDMSDSLSKSVPFDYLQTEIIESVQSDRGRRHCWLWLTKRPNRMALFSDWMSQRDITWPSNLWVGTSITTQATIGRIRDLLKVGDNSTVRFLSVEPQIEPLDIEVALPRLDWLIQGGESGAAARPFQIEWAVELAKQCRVQGVPFFLKQLGADVRQHGRKIRLYDAHGGDWSEWPEDLRIREVPKARTQDSAYLPRGVGNERQTSDVSLS